MLEMALTAVMHKILGPEFIVVRTASVDDYTKKIDKLIINKETGDVVCAFDEVNDEQDGKFMQAKQDAVIKAARQGGVDIDYGITFEKDPVTRDNKMVKGKIKNVLKFYLGISKKDLSDLISNMNYDTSQPPNNIELKLFDQLTAMLREQVGLIGRQNLKENIWQKLEKFIPSLDQMEELRNAKFPNM